MALVQSHAESIGPQPLPPQVTTLLFDRYIGGSSLMDLFREFPEYTRESIAYTAYHYSWPTVRDDLIFDMQTQMKQKVMASKMKQLDLVSNMIEVAHREANQALLAYIKHPCDKNLPKTLRIKTIKELQVAVDMIGTIINQDNQKNIKVDGKIQTDGAGGATSNGKLSSEIASELLKALSSGQVVVEEKKK